jgi:hypothetical protein
MTNKSKKKSRSRLFNGILKLVCDKQIKEEFKVSDVISILGTCKPFLSKHCIDPLDPNKKATGNTYFIRISKGIYKINPIFKICQ